MYLKNRLKSRRKKNDEKINLLHTGGASAAVLYLVCIGIYCRISNDPIIFFASLVISLIVSVGVGVGIYFLLKRNIDKFSVVTMIISYLLGLVILSVFGPTFIDRSISYHIAFYAVDEGEVNVEKIRDEFSYAIFDKRIHDAIATGFIEDSGTDGVYVPTKKAYVIDAILKPIGKLTDSLGTYEEMREAVNDEH